jgi:hypothetical protein
LGVGKETTKRRVDGGAGHRLRSEPRRRRSASLASQANFKRAGACGNILQQQAAKKRNLQLGVFQYGCQRVADAVRVQQQVVALV